MVGSSRLEIYAGNCSNIYIDNDNHCCLKYEKLCALDGIQPEKCLCFMYRQSKIGQKSNTRKALECVVKEQ